ncbi:MAG TPA: zinc dependent phospholipase C family protein [Cyclobacteriaceae bacterium]|nr:zinc dependent phospholipase C family protein [Cyclobacteriaceae bacterium]
MIRLFILGSAVVFVCSAWGFFGHKKINRLAVFTLPVEMAPFYKKNVRYIEESAVNPDRRRYIVPDEAPRHFIDLDNYGDSAVFKLPRYWSQAVEMIGEDSLNAHGILPWNIQRVYLQLRDAFFVRNPDRILKLSADLGHYLADAHVPLHTTKNYNGQLTNQVGIHALWESRLPELFSTDYDFYTGKAQYVSNVQKEAWKIVVHTNEALDSVLRFEKQMSELWGEKKYNFESQGKLTIKVFSVGYSKAYHDKLSGMVERQMRASVLMIGSLWYSAWVDAGQPDLRLLMDHKPTEEELRENEVQLEQMKKEKRALLRPHEGD